MSWWGSRQRGLRRCSILPGLPGRGEETRLASIWDLLYTSRAPGGRSAPPERPGSLPRPSGGPPDFRRTVMAIAPTARIHPTAVIPPEAELADDVEIGPFVVIEGAVRVGTGCRIRPHAHLIGPLTMGCDNLVFSGVVLGEQPQHLRYAGERTGLEIGDGNIFREHVTVHRGTTHSWTTRIGNHNFFMAHSHVAHDCVIGNQCLLANGALLGGHCVLEDGVFLSGNCAVHQFVRLGRL